MKDLDKREFADIWGAAWAMYGKSVSPQLLSIAFEALRAYSIEEVRLGLTRHIQSPDTGQFFPKPADVIKHIDGNSTTKAMIAWNKVDKAVRQIGSWTSVMFDDALIHRVISDMGGWRDLCKADDKQYPFMQKDFITRYQNYLLRNEIGEYPKLLTGIADQQNQQNGFATQTPIAIGERAKAEQVYANGRADYSSVSLQKISSKSIQKLFDTRSEVNHENN